VDWVEVDRLLVHGETHVDPTTNLPTIYYPSLREVAERYGVSLTRMWTFAREKQCYIRRDGARAHAIVAIDEAVGPRAPEDKRAIAIRLLTTDDLIATIDLYLGAFRRAIEEGRVRCEDPLDFERLVRLREFLSGKPDSRREVNTQLTLEQIQERHSRFRLEVEHITTELTGALAEGMAPRSLKSSAAATPDPTSKISSDNAVPNTDSGVPNSEIPNDDPQFVDVPSSDGRRGGRR
jgi:hypothetical protein